MKSTDEIVRALQNYASDCGADEACFQCTVAWMCDELGGNAPKIIANTVERLQSKLAAYEDTGLSPDEIPRWIPVSERLPKENEYRDKATGELIPLLVCARSTEYPFRAFYDGKNWGDGFNRIDVAHWMPLPQPPKEEK
jgi:hypothetical protein